VSIGAPARRMAALRARSGGCAACRHAINPGASPQQQKAPAMLVISYVFNAVINLYTVVVFVAVIMSWLIGFNVINRHNQLVDAIWRTCLALTEPLLRPIRNALPNLGGIDISPIILLIALQAVQIGVNAYILRPLGG
jgi:YggT family protein